LLPEILQGSGPLPAVHPEDGVPIVPGRIYVAPPDHHLLVKREHIRVVFGPKENRFRPAIDPLFRTAAMAYGKRVVGVVLSGLLYDGTAGLFEIKERGGVAIVQDPKEAVVPCMPQSAIKHVAVDHILSIEDMARVLIELSYEPVL
jgi:two-component system chemotaxis response regulator CheB